MGSQQADEPDDTNDNGFVDDSPIADPHVSTGHGGPGHTSTGLDAALAMRRARRRNRVAEMEWFELAYRVYLAAFLGGGAVLWLSDLVTDDPVGAAGIADVTAHGPAWLGMIAVAAAAFGVRSGANGGPLAVEDADVRHLLLAPIDHATVLRQPTIQRLRTVCFAAAVTGGVIGQLAARRLPGTGLAWAGAGALFGAACGALFVAVALLTHGAHLPRWAATLVATALLAWQGASIADKVPGPGDGLGESALWGMEVHGIDLVSLVVVALVVVVSFFALRRLSLEALARRSALVSQLRFAVTLQDLRTVMLLRRQLAQEHSRAEPWVRLRRRGRLPAVWRRGWQGILRFPSSRLVRMVALVAAAAVCQVLVWRGTTPLIVGSGVAMFVLGLELLEPLSQEIDQSDRTDALPVNRGLLHVRLVAPSAVAAVPLALVGVAIAWAMERTSGTLLVGAVVSLPVILGGMAGSALNIVAGAPDPNAAAAERNMMPPEVAGTTTLIKAAWPVVVSVLGSTPVLGARAAADNGTSAAAGGFRVAVMVVLVSMAVGGWVRYRDDVKAWMRQSAEQGRAAQGRGTGGTR